MAASKREWTFAILMSTSHGAQHFFSRLLPPLIPILAVKLSLPLWKLGFLISVYSLFSGWAQTPMGILSDKYDRRYILPPGLGVMAFGYLVFAVAPVAGATLPVLRLPGYTFSGPFIVMCVGMAVSGIGASVTHPTGYPLITANIGEDKKGKTLGLWGSAAKVGDAAAPALVGVLILVLVWNKILFLFGVLGIIFAVALFAFLGFDAIETLPPEHESKTDDAIDEEKTTVWEADKRLFVYPMLAVILFFTTRTIATNGINAFVPVFITDTYGYSFHYFGLNMGPESFANFYFSALLLMAAGVQLITGGLTDTYDHRKILIAFLSLSTIALVLLSFLTLPPLALFLVLLMVGAGLWGLNPARDALVSQISPPEREGRTFGYLWTLTQVMGSLSPVLIGYIAGISGIQDSFKYLAVATALSALAVVLLFSKRVYRHAGQKLSGANTAD